LIFFTGLSRDPVPPKFDSQKLKDASFDYMKRILLSACALALSACSTLTPNQSGFLPADIVLRSTDVENFLVYRAPNFELSSYAPMRALAAQVYSPSVRLIELDPKLQKELLQEIDLKTTSQLVNLTNLGTRTIVLRIALTDVATPNRALNVVTSLLIGPVTVGGARLEIALTDDSSGEVVFAATCTENASVIRQFTGAYSVIPHAKHAVDKCIEHFAKAIQ
jgi:Protein of unknown function (DUF3313)